MIQKLNNNNNNNNKEKLSSEKSVRALKAVLVFSFRLDFQTLSSHFFRKVVDAQ